jgi:hypothetical protein
VSLFVLIQGGIIEFKREWYIGCDVFTYVLEIDDVLVPNFSFVAQNPKV